MALKPITSDSTDRFCCMVIAESGMGKTSLIRTVLGQEWQESEKKWAPKAENGAERVCVLSAESGLLCVRDLVKGGKVEGFEIGSITDFKEAYELLSSNSEAKSRYQWVFVDSLTEISDRCNKYMREKYPEKTKTFDRWDEYSVLMTTLIKGFRDLTDYNVVFTCLPSTDKDANNVRFIAPNVVGKSLKETLVSIFDEVFYMKSFQSDDGTDFRAFVTGPYENYPAKDRSGMLDLIEKPDLAWIKKKIFNDDDIPF